MADSIPSLKRVDFEPDSLPATGPSARDAAAPAVSSSSALARFEFESGRGNDGTKILMVEWSDDDDAENTGDWEVSWEGKSTVLSAKDGAEGKLHRLYFLLPPRSPVPPIVKLEQRGGKTMQTNPLPAIFPPALGVSATTAGKKGVLHTLWAKKRLSVLQREIEQERENGEGVGLEMAVQEKAWIEHNFGVGAKGLSDVSSASPKSPPGSGRLSEKLRGLKLGTSVSELSSTPGHDPAGSNTLSPDHGDVALSSFSLFHGHTARPPRAVAQQPPQHLLAMQNDSSRVSSLDAIATGFIPSRNETETEDDLFAVKLSPRSPEMKKSPFSFSTSDTARWIKTDE